MALLRQVIVAGYLFKEIEQYGVLKLTKSGYDFIENPIEFMMTEDHSYDKSDDGSIITKSKGGGVTDDKLMAILKDLRKSIGKKKGVPPYVVFQDPSLEDMTLKYPITIEELSKVHGVGEGKAKKYGKEFADLIAKYVEENDVIRPDDLIVKSTGVNSALKLYIIQNTDKKIPLGDIAKSKGIEMSELIKIIEQIIFSGTKINIDYCINEILDEEQQEEIHDYFMEAESDKIQEALDEFDGDYDEEELRLMRIKFISEVAN
jgi:ATP-dependent DNA helicase RecQ